MTETLTSPAGRRLGIFGAAALISASAALGAGYGWALGAQTHAALGVVLAGAALGGEALKPFAVAQALSAARSREWLHGLACAALGLVCVAYSFAAQLSLASAARGDLAAQRAATIDARAAAKASRERAVRELATLAPARSPETLRPLIAALKQTKGADGCLSRSKLSAARQACAEAANLESEAARHAQRAALELKISGADAALRSPDSNQVGASDPLASAVAVYASAAGFNLRADTLNLWLSLVPVLFLEIGSALSLVVLRNASAPPSAQRTLANAPQSSAGAACEDAPLPMPPSEQTPASDEPQGSEPQLTDKSNGDPFPAREPHEDEQKIAKAVLTLVAQRGGKISAGQRSIARAVGFSKSRVNEVLNEMAASGRIILQPTPQGTSVALA